MILDFIIALALLVAAFYVIKVIRGDNDEGSL